MRINWCGGALAALVMLLSACGGGGGSSNPPVSRTVSGSATGLNGTGLTLQLNGAADLALTGNGSYTFSTAVSEGGTYAVTIKSQPSNPAQTCVLSNASGSVGATNISNVAVSCTTNTYSAGGAVTGLAGSGLVLQLNGTVDLPVAANGTFAFPGIASGSPYAVTVKTQPATPYQMCAVSNGSGNVIGSAVTNIAVACSLNFYGIGASVSGLSGSGLVLQLPGSTDLTIAANGTTSFPVTLASGSSYSVSVKTQPTSPAQTCAATAGGSGVVANGAITVAVTCMTNTYAVGGTITGLQGSDLVLQLNGGQDLAVASNGSFVFPAAILSGTQYAVTIKSQTSLFRELCFAGNASGTVGGSAVSTVQINCTVVQGFVYVVGAGGKVIQYGFHPQTGALTPAPATGVTLAFQTLTWMAAPNGSALYAVDLGTNLISTFAVEPGKGTLSAVGAPVPTGGSGARASIAISPSNEFLYIANAADNTIVRFSIDPTTHALTSEGVAAMVVTAGQPGMGIALTPDGAFMYVLRTSGPVVSPSSTLNTYSVDATTGALTLVATDGSLGLEEPVVTMDPLGRFLYLHDSQFVPNIMSSIVRPYAIDPGTGALTASATTTLTNNGGQLIVEPLGRFAYMLDTANTPPGLGIGNYVDALTVDGTTGVLTPVGSHNFIHALPTSIGGDASGKFLFVGSSEGYDAGPTWYDVTGFSINATGPTAGQLSAAGKGQARTGANGRLALIAIVE